MVALPVGVGSGSTQNPRNLEIPASRTNGQNPSADWWSKYVGSYNRPTSIASADYYARQAAEKRNAEIIAEAQQRAEDERLRRQAVQQQQQKAAAGSVLSPADAAKMAQMEAEQNAPTWGQRLADWLTSEAPNPFPNPLGADGKPLPTADQRAEQKQRTEAGLVGVSPTRGPEQIGYTQQPVMGASGQIVGYKYVKLIQPTMVTAEDQTAAVQNTPGMTDNPMLRREMDATIYDEIASLEQTYAKRRYDAAVRMWGEPTKDPRTGELDWSQSGREYLGMAPGEIASPTLQEPAADAPYSEFVKYRDRLKAQQSALNRQPYTESSVKEAYYSMGTQGIKQLQRTFLAAGLYDSNDIVALGNVGEKELSFMTDLMTLANINGTTWEEQFSIFQSAAQQQAARGGGGGGGGGGGAGGTSVYTQVQYTQTSLAQGRALLISVLKDALGRYPTDDEVARFVDMLNKAESKSPTTTVTRTTKEGKTSRSVARTTPSEVDTQAMAEEFAESIGGGAPAAANKRDNYLIGYLNSLGGSIG